MIPFQTINWETIPPIEHSGASGISISRTFQSDIIRLRLVDFSPKYKADHWCGKGHVIYCLDGDFVLHLKDGSKNVVTKGMTCQMLDDTQNPHLMISESGCKLFILDGEFLA
jgi:hypothetical protein